MLKDETRPLNQWIPVEKALENELKMALHKVLSDNETELTTKMQMVIDKTIKRIGKKMDKQIEKHLKSNSEHFE